ncbi:MAG: histidine triad nucleotide-binding protein [Anaerolineaceae bacterium]
MQPKMDMSDCVFCSIVAKKSPAKILYEDDQVIVIEDIHPVAPVHLLIISRKHIPSLNELQPEDSPLLSHMLLTARKIAREVIGEDAAYRTVINTGSAAGQTVFHLHLHLIAGRPFASGLFTRGLK